MLNIPKLTLANSLLSTTDYHTITDNQAENISIAFKEYQTRIDDSALQKLYINIKPLGKSDDDQYYKLQEMSIYEMKDRSYIYNPNIKGNPLKLRKIAVMPTLHHSTVGVFPRPSVKEVFSQLPELLQRMGNILFHTDFPKYLIDMPFSNEQIELYGGEEKIKKLIQPVMLRRYYLHLGETTFFKLQPDSLQDAAIATIIAQLSNNGCPLKLSINKLPLPPILIKDILKLMR